MIPFAQLPLRFDGSTYDPCDQRRLARQTEGVYALMHDGEWRTLAEIEHATGYPQASISARLRDLRKFRFGSHVIERRRRSPGQFEYRMTS